MSLRALVLLALCAMGEAFYWVTNPRYELYSTYYAHEYEDRGPQWAISKDAYELKVRLPDVEPTTVRAALASDGTKVELVAERKIDGCSCSPTTVKEVALPYRPRAEDVDVALDKDNVVSLRLTRHAKTESATPLKVTSVAKDAAEEKMAEETRPLRFVPHESAQAPSKLEEQEKTVTEKFRSVALAAAAVQRTEASAKETAAATAEHEAAAADGAAPKESATDGATAAATA